MSDITSGTSTATLWRSAVEHHPRRTFLVHVDQDGRRLEFTYAEAAASVHRGARALESLGVGMGDVVLLQGRNTPTMLWLLFGLFEIGAVAVPVGMGATRAEIARAYRNSGATWAVVDSTRSHVHADLLQEGQVPLHTLVSCDGREENRTSQPEGVSCTFEELVRGQDDSLLDVRLEPATMAEILYTSGTTSAPKGVMITQANLVFSGHYGVWQASLRADDRMLTTMPACHSNFQLAALMPVLVAGATLVLVERYSARSYWQTVCAEGATVIQMLSMMARTLLLQPEREGEKEHLVRDAMYFMAISDEEKAAFEQRFGVRLLNSYGSTESIGWALTDPPVGERRWPSVGRPGLGYGAAILGPDGVELPPGGIGEICIRGMPGVSLMAGYHNDPEGTASTLEHTGWLHTNDEGYMDEDGWFYFVDRSVDMVKCSGENVSTTEVEKVLTSHPSIAEAAVVGVPDPVRDAAVAAFIRLRPGTRISTDQVIAHCSTMLNPYKVPQVVEVVDDFPRTESLKIEKRLLRDRMPARTSPNPQCCGNERK